MAGLLLVVALEPAPGAQAQESAPTRHSRLLERTDVSLMLLDVRVEDENGQPLPGLTRDDFLVQLNGLRRPVDSLDDFCPAPGSPAALAAVAARVPPRFVLYVDLARLSQDARVTALELARRWIREVMQAGDLVQLAAFASPSGLTELTDFTSDRQALLAGLERLETAPEFVDTFSLSRGSRVDDCIACCQRCAGACEDCCSQCTTLSTEEYLHDRSALRALKWYVRGLEPLPDRKALLLFYQSAGQYPGRSYGILNNNLIGDHVALLDDLAAEATVAQTVIYPAYVGDVGDQARGEAVNFGANLADFTGGRHSRGGGEIAFLTEAGRKGGCFYRIGLRKPAGTRRDLFRATVSVRDRPLPHQFRVQFLDANDRWWRRAQGVLESPEKWDDIGVSAALVPTRATRKGWDFDVQVALDLDSLARFPAAGRQQAEWEVGALLHRPGTGKAWEMLGVSTVRSKQAAAAGAHVLHRHSFLELAPGTYHLGAFVRDRAANVFGAAESIVTLPAPRKAGAVGPLLMLSRRKHLDSALPLINVGDKAEAPRAVVRDETLPALGGIPVGESLELHSWICPGGRSAPPPTDVLRFVVRDDDEPLFRFEPVTPDAAGLCYRITDRLDTSALGPGRFTYHVRYRPGQDQPSIESELEFELQPAPVTRRTSATPR